MLILFLMIIVETYVSSVGRGYDFCFIMRCFMRPLVVSVAVADSILSVFEAVTKPFDPSFTTSFMLSLREFLPFFPVLLRVFYAFFGPNVQSLRFLSLVFAHSLIFALIWSVFARFPLTPALSGVSVHSFITSLYLAVSSDSCDFYNYVSSGCVIFSHSES